MKFNFKKIAKKLQLLVLLKLIHCIKPLAILNASMSFPWINKIAFAINWLSTRTTNWLPPHVLSSMSNLLQCWNISTTNPNAKQNMTSGCKLFRRAKKGHFSSVWRTSFIQQAQRIFDAFRVNFSKCLCQKVSRIKRMLISNFYVYEVMHYLKFLFVTLFCMLSACCFVKA